MAGLASQPNVILIMCDQMRWDAAGFAGSPTVRTPNLDRLAAAGVCFENAYCASPVCSPARASWLTGLYPHAHRQLRNYSPSKKGVSGHPPASRPRHHRRCPEGRGIPLRPRRPVAPRATTTGRSTGSPTSGAPTATRGNTRTGCSSTSSEREFPTSISRTAPGMTQYANTLEFGTLQDPPSAAHHPGPSTAASSSSGSRGTPRSFCGPASRIPIPGYWSRPSSWRATRKNRCPCPPPCGIHSTASPPFNGVGTSAFLPR